jgi:thiol-disulfide isomerase/thioredoxin
MVAIVAGWCPPCRAKMAPIRGVMQRLGPAFVGVIDIYQDRDFNAADGNDAEAWANQYDLPFVVPDPQFIMADYLPNGRRREQYILIDAATMEIVHRSANFVPDEVERRAREWLAP